MKIDVTKNRFFGAYHREMLPYRKFTLLVACVSCLASEWLLLVDRA